MSQENDDLKRGRGRPPFEPTEDERKMVKELASLGTRQPDICRFIKRYDKPINETTLRKYFAEELALGTLEANARVAATLYKMATSGDSPASTFFWLKTRARWQETPQQHAFTDPDGNPMPAPSLGDFYATVSVVRKGEPPEQSDSEGDG